MEKSKSYFFVVCDLHATILGIGLFKRGKTWKTKYTDRYDLSWRAALTAYQ